MFSFLNGSLLLRAGSAMGVITVLAVAAMAGTVYVARTTHGEAGAVNMAGSLRMQSYRLVATLEANHKSGAHLADTTSSLAQEFEQRLNSPKLTEVVSNTHRTSLQQSYSQIKKDWTQTILPLIQEYVHQINQPASKISLQQISQTYRTTVDSFVVDIDRMVRLLEEDAESSIHLLGLTHSISLMLILLVAAITLYLLHTDVLSPLHDLLKSAERAGQGDFNVRVAHTGPDELGRLGQTFNTMTEEISKMYGHLEKRVTEKTEELTRRNRSLELLYNASQRLTKAAVSETTYLELLEEIGGVIECEGITLCLIDEEKNKVHALAGSGTTPPMCQNQACDICLGDGKTRQINSTEHGGPGKVLSIPVRDQENHYGVLLVVQPKEDSLQSWQIRLLETLSKHIGISIGVTHRVTQHRRLALLDERSAIARDLHDSLAQSLSYLKIQVTRLTILRESRADDQQIDEVQNELKDGLDAAYRQLRELLTTFRLQMNGRGLASALSETISEFKTRSDVEIQLDNQLTLPLSVNEEIHLLQIVRESLANLVHHAQATQATVTIQPLENSQVQVRIEDNGMGIQEKTARTHHYGLAIMHERANSLNGKLQIENRPEGGTCVLLKFKPGGTKPNLKTIQEQAAS